MKAVIMLFACSLLLSFTVYEYQIKPSTAEATQVQGLYIFTDSKPVSDYEYLGTVKTGVTLHGYYSEIKDNLIKKTKKEYPIASGLIIASNSESADVIVLK